MADSMERVACRACGNPVHPAARECPSCGAVDPVAVESSAPSAGDRVMRAGKSVGCFAIAVVALVLAVIVFLLSLVF